MKLFEHPLMNDETLFSNIDSLDPDYVPKLLPHREGQQEYVAECIKPLLQGRNGTNLLLSGHPGIGKTASVKRVMQDLAESYNLPQSFVNCWNVNSSHKILTSIAEQLGYKFTVNMSSDDLIKKISRLTEKGCVFVFDEIDKAMDYDFLYNILEGVPKRTIILITNDTTWLSKLDSRIRSRMVPEQLNFDRYKASEINDILKERRKLSYYDGAWTDEAFDAIVERSAADSDIRIGIYLLRESGLLAERDASRQVKAEHAAGAIGKIKDFSPRSADSMTEDEKMLIGIIKGNSGKIIGEIFSIYQNAGGTKSQRTVDRIVKKLEKKGIIELKATGEGFKGKSTILIFKGF